MTQPTGFSVIKPGFLTLLQDLGRKGVAHLGVSTSGVMDYWSAHWANRLCGNASYMPVLEIVMGALELKALASTVMCVTGADVKVTINGQKRACWQSHAIRAGDILKIERPDIGMRNYLAVRGGFVVQPILNSVATNMREGIGGITGDGQLIRAGDLLQYRQTAATTSLILPKRFIDWGWFDDVGCDPGTIRMIPGGQYSQFSKSARKTLLSNSYRISQDSNRMGYRLQGKAVVHDMPGMLSEATGLGAIQVPGDGQPIVLLQDRQTLGGYPKIGSVCAVDCWRLAQLAPGETVKFKLVSLHRAQSLFRQLHIYMRSISPISSNY
ncbi:biotin-dependent carboxyltransferase [Paraneptunicella aestuarii]|uniref:5-oxoprolinase subunit C family protein n=1 Tax=Paraneptunicella aestuarii TaxID=2831148 RepID=UPI001E39F3D7|nr:biotin-dependent carboxyltransferase family protein [Paraneptunicella aestuarii]UAA37279.1 biotin-dependent carboxyltransferase [Paraneptunicella aestuarii]